MNTLSEVKMKDVTDSLQANGYAGTVEERLRTIDRRHPDGRLLWAAVVILSTSPNIHFLGGRRNGRDMTPFEILDELEKVASANDNTIN